MKERKKRVLAERRIETLESSSRQLVQHYDARFVELARQVGQPKKKIKQQISFCMWSLSLFPWSVLLSSSTTLATSALGN